MSWDSPVDDQRFESKKGLQIFLFTTMSRPALESTQPPLQWVPGALSLEVKQPGHEADHSALSSAKAKNARNYTSTPPLCLHGIVLSYSTGTSLPLCRIKLFRTGVSSPTVYACLLLTSTLQNLRIPQKLIKFTELLFQCRIKNNTSQLLIILNLHCN
jgi:hypothetical protein